MTNIIDVTKMTNERPKDIGKYHYFMPYWVHPIIVEVVDSAAGLGVKFHHDLIPCRITNIPSAALWQKVV